jgi:hypothetical protein
MYFINTFKALICFYYSYYFKNIIKDFILYKELIRVLKIILLNLQGMLVLVVTLM